MGAQLSMDKRDDSLEGDLQDGNTDGYVSPLGEVHTRTARLSGFQTRSGYRLKEIEINYLTLGKLSPEKDNAILICHALSGNAHVAGAHHETGRPGWWDLYVGPGKTIDTNKFFVICSNVIGGCNGSTGPTSINPDTGQAYGMEFPPITIEDMVRGQVELIDHLGIQKLFSVMGGSMGGMQALIWATHYPSRVQTCIPLATCMAHSAMQIAFNEVGRQAILNDPKWQDGEYNRESRPEHGLAVARMVAHVTYLSEFSMQDKFGRRQQRPPSREDLFPMYFSVESYLHYQGESFVKRFDPNSYLYITKALDMFDLLGGNNPEDIFSSVEARFLVVSFESDWLYPPSQSRELVRALKRSRVTVTYLNLETPNGHDSFLIHNVELFGVLGNFLNVEYRNMRDQGALATNDSGAV